MGDPGLEEMAKLADKLTPHQQHWCNIARAAERIYVMRHLRKWGYDMAADEIEEGQHIPKKRGK